MGSENSENDGGIGSVKAAISRYGGQVNQNTGSRKIYTKNAANSKERGSQAPELHTARKTFGKLNENREIAEAVACQAELELRQAKMVVKELSLQIEELKLKASDQSTQKLVQVENQEYLTMVRETEVLRQEVSKMKLDIKRTLEEKSRAEDETNAAGLRLDLYMESIEKLRREIEEANEEEVLVELARIEACRELAVIDARKKEEAENFSSRIREVMKKINVLRNEVEQVKQAEDVLVVINSEVVALQNELDLIKEMESSGNSLSKNSEFRSVEDDMEAARKEQSLMKARVFQIMTSTDLIRVELNNILDEKDQIEKEESATEKYLKKLNSKLVREKDELKHAVASAGKAELMLPSLTLSLRELKTVKEETHEERKCILEDIVSIKRNVQKIESMTDLTEGKLCAVMQELEEAKKAEANAMKKLKILVESVVANRATKNADTITVSKFEYDYLVGGAKGAKEIADKKIAAAHAWADALRANVKEMQIKTKLAKNEITELKLKEERELNELEMQKKREQEKRNVRGTRLMIESSYSLTPVRQAKFRKSFGSPAARRPIISTFWTVERKRKAMGKTGNYFAKEQTENEKTDSLEVSR
ncbi:hypothetical protein RND81_08G224400 [Saponaria officinalis]|uniref:Protein PLASTID MOVEMENT IMPAIRED 2 n=1 Tax=Saponaria officinalis TaxID=3572 RepID=A0AAW1JBG1_SAPOF